MPAWMRVRRVACCGLERVRDLSGLNIIGSGYKLLVLAGREAGIGSDEEAFEGWVEW